MPNNYEVHLSIFQMAIGGVADPLPGATTLVTAGPNPSAGATRTRLALAEGGSVRAEVFDTGGRFVFGQVGVQAAGDLRLTRDGMDFWGRLVPPGRYQVSHIPDPRAWATERRSREDDAMKIGRATAALARDAILVAMGIVTVAVPTGCGGKPLSSTWRCTDITVDGAVEDWGETRQPLEKQKVILGVTHDAEYLYLTFTPGDDAMQRQILMLGLTIWFDPQGAKNEHLGIRFPRGARGDRFPFRDHPVDIATEVGRKQFSATLDSLEVLRAGSRQGDPFAVDELGGVAVRAQLVGDVFVYELRLPLARSAEHLYAVGAQPGDVIGIGLQTPALDRRRMLEGMPGAGPAGGGAPGGSGSGRGPGGRRGPGGGNGERPGGFGPTGTGERLDVWLPVQLARPAPGEAATPLATPESQGNAQTGSPDSP